ncbi:hypothetical protein [Microbacterium maritypicum]|uniref:Uncharacterized protein n=1 Tax=Microbacterium maritypicum TaxID=33918 RepID=A0A4Y4B7Z6_MICMQ|nr:hypothetical protein [Microbacterium liquefaciens]GEC76691.1 hypothetical protein MLI01_28360 [Microbacterium liquefaciens]GGV61995.1 hypothetical protein GCM10010213_26120 [Microbacterium liquefaciens]
MSDIDLTTVPPYPVYRLEVDAHGAVTLDGVPIAEGDGATEEAIEHVAGILRADGHDAVRVIAVTPDGTDRMVVEADGTTHVIVDEVHDGKMAIGNRRVSRRAVIASIVTVAGLVVIGAATPVAIALTRPAPTPTATIAPPPGEGEQLAVLAPPGYDQTAAWAVAIRSNTTPTFLPDGRIAITTEAGDLRLLDPDTGKTVWKGNGSARGGKQLAATTIDGYDVLATARSGALTVWPLYVEDSTVDSVDYDLPRGAEVSFLGTEPLIVLPDQTVGFVTADGITRQDIPVTARPVMTTDAGVIAVDDTTIYTITPEGEVTGIPYTRPEGAGAITNLSAADSNTLIIVWSDEAQQDVIGAVDVATGDLPSFAVTRSAGVRNGATPLHAVDGTTLTYGSVWIRYGTSPSVRPLGTFTPTAITGTMVYGTANREAGWINVLDEQPQVSPFTTQELPLDPIAPSGITPDMAWIVADKVETTYLYALPRRNGAGDPTATPAP